MKKLLVALALATTAASASATSVSSGYLYVDNAVTTALTEEWGPVGQSPFGVANYNVGDNGYTGTLKAINNGTFTATYLGQKASFANRYMALGNILDGAGHPNLCNPCSAIGPNSGSTGVGSTSSIYVAADTAVDFAFGTDVNGNGLYDAVDAATVVANGDANTVTVNKTKGILFFLNTFGLKDGSGKLFDFLIGYDDNNKDNDFDDFVVGVRHVPVPAALPLLASAFAAFGIARRKNKQA